MKEKNCNTLEIYNEFKERLLVFLEKDGEFLHGEKATDYLEFLYKYIGDPDPDLRDELVYPVFATLVSSDEYLSKEEVSLVLDKLLSDEFLHYQLGEAGTDSVFKRAFSALVLVPIIDRHIESPFLSHAQIVNIFERCMAQIRSEAGPSRFH